MIWFYWAANMHHRLLVRGKKQKTKKAQKDKYHRRHEDF